MMEGAHSGGVDRREGRPVGEEQLITWRENQQN